MSSETVLVTGAGGFIGSNLVDDQLRRGRKVLALDMHLDKLDHQKDNDSCELVPGDINDRELLEKLMAKTDVVMHLASAHLEVSIDDAYFWKTNVEAVKTMLELARAHGVRRFVHCSTVGVYGPLESLPASEQTECHPDILYEETKLAGENEVRKFVQETGFSAVILRPAWVYGPRCPRTLKLFRTLKKKRFFNVGECANYRHPIYISDMLDAFDLAAEKDSIDGDTFLIASENPVQLKELIESIISVQKLNYRPVTVPFFVMKPVCVIVERLFGIISKEPPFSTRSLKFFTESSAFKIDKAKSALGFDPKVELAEGLAKTYQYYLDENLL